MISGFKPPIIPTTFFGTVLGLAGLDNAWRAAHLVWRAPALGGEALMALVAVVWALLLLLFILKRIFTREERTIQFSAASSALRASQRRPVAPFYGG
jgi:tellurite resistance protein TehA-like permease